MADIEKISETARWVALYRAMESERPDAHFRDVYARRLAGEWDEEKLRRIPRGHAVAGPMVVRTVVFDEIIVRLLHAERIDLVVNLAAGLDARPYRLPLPSGLRWVEVDLPETIEYKEELLRDASPGCELERVALDLRDAEALRALCARLGSGAERALLLTEGLLVYLPPQEVSALAEELSIPEAFRFWITDLVSPMLLEWMRKSWSSTTSADVVFRFAPEDGARFFGAFGWAERECFSLMEEARRLRREIPFASLWRFLLRLSSAEKRERYRRLTTIVLLERPGA